MPAAPDYRTLFDFETAIEPALKALLLESGVPAAFTQAEFDDLPNARVDIQFALGAATGTRQRDATGKLWLSVYNYRLTLGIVTPREVAGVAQKTTHARWRANLRILLQYASEQLNDAALLPYHALTMVEEDGTAPSVVSGDDCDVSELSFKGIVSIRTGAWPASDVPTFDSTTAFTFDSIETPTFDAA